MDEITTNLVLNFLKFILGLLYSSMIVETGFLASSSCLLETYST